MNYLSADSISKSYGDKLLFEDLSFGVSKGQRVALVGRNGCGKSSLLRILAGQDTPDTGEVSLRSGIRLAFLDQAPNFNPEHKVMEAVFAGDHPALKLISEYEALSNQANPDGDRLQQVMEQMDVHQAWEYEVRVREVLTRLNVFQLDLPVGKMSGGQRKRVALARVLINEPDFLVMDEPTNHLDTETIEWLEEYVAARNLTLLLVTHDRYFLDRLCNEIIEIDQGQVFFYEGNYQYFLEKKAEREGAEDQVAERARNLLVKELEWLRRQPKARGTKSKARIDAAHELKDKAKRPQREGSIQMEFKSQRLGSKILELHGVSKSYGNLKLLDNFEYVFKKGEKIGMVGPNGVGKSTFLNMITGALEPDAGEIITGQTVAFGYYRQEGLTFAKGQTVIELIKESAESVAFGNEQLSAGIMLTLFGFPPKSQYTHVSELSGGEKRRLHLLQVLMTQPNFLILDEPTNDLDIITLNTLEQFLLSFKGCMIIVSHDRYFLDKLTDHLFVFEGKGIVKPWPGNFREYRVWKKQQAAEAPKVSKPKAQPSTPQPKREKTKLSFNEKREFEALGGEIETLEARKAELNDLLNSGSTDHEALSAWAIELESLNESLDEKEMRWLELSEFAD